MWFLHTNEVLPETCVEARAEAAASWPRITLVTPVRNSAAYIEQTICSVLHQRYPNLEYFIVDGGSTDGTIEIIRKYEKELAGWISEPDRGMYDALNKGFRQSTGDIMGWISATDLLHVGGLAVVGTVFRDLPLVEWITGHATGFDDSGMTVVIAPLCRWSRYRFLAGANRYIQQESTFWRRSLWEKAGGHVDDSRRIAADFELWARFFRHAQLFTIDALIGGFRAHGDSLGLTDMEACHRVHDEVIEKELESAPKGRWIRAFRRIDRRIIRIRKVRYLWRKLVIRGLYELPGPDWPPVIRYGPRRWVLSR
jgi:glycosyltransferase involved in cell wall biosynthesis